MVLIRAGIWVGLIGALIWWVVIGFAGGGGGFVFLLIVGVPAGVAIVCTLYLIASVFRSP